MSKRLSEALQELEIRVATLEGSLESNDEYGYAILLTEEEMGPRGGRYRVINKDYPSISDNGRLEGSRIIRLYSSEEKALAVLAKLADYMGEEVYGDEFSEEFDLVISTYKVVEVDRAEVEKTVGARFKVVTV
jgi:hypothetical protein